VTTATKPAPHHDNLTCYTDYRCRRPACVERYNVRNRERLQARRLGTYDRLIDAEPARRHILRLQHAGMSCAAVAVAAGLTTQSILEFVRPIPSQGRGRRQRTTPTTEAKILAVTLGDRTTGRIDATGTLRRVQALAALGWPTRHIAVHAGLQAANAHHLEGRARVYVATANAIAKTYDELRRKRPEKHGVTKSHAQRARNRAALAHWAPPKYWDDPDHPIDDAGFEPDYGVTRRQQIADDARWLMTVGGLNKEQVALRLRRSASYVNEALRDYPADDGQAAA